MGFVVDIFEREDERVLLRGGKKEGPVKVGDISMMKEERLFRAKKRFER